MITFTDEEEFNYSMTLIIALETRDGITVVGDTLAGRIYNEFNKDLPLFEERIKVFSIGRYAAIGISGNNLDYRVDSFAAAIKFGIQNVPSQDLESLAIKILELIPEYFKEKIGLPDFVIELLLVGYDIDESGQVSKEHFFLIQHSNVEKVHQVIEAKQWAAIGTGNQAKKLLLEINPSKNISSDNAAKLAKRVIKEVAKDNQGIAPPYTVINISKYSG